MAGKCLDKFHVLRDLVTDEIECFQVLDDLARHEDMAVFELDHRSRHLAELLVGVAHHGDIQDLVMFLYSGLDLVGEDVHPAGDDHLFIPAGEVQKPVFIKVAQKTVVEPGLAIHEPECALEFLGRPHIVEAHRGEAAAEDPAVRTRRAPGSGLFIKDLGFSTADLTDALIALGIFFIVSGRRTEDAPVSEDP